MRVAVFTTSYPRDEADYAGRFVADAVERLRARGVEVEVVAPGDYRDFRAGSDGRGLVQSLRARPWEAPPLGVSMVRALRRAAARADLVHAHWLAGAGVAALAGKPFVVTLHGTVTAGRFDDFELLRRAPRPVRALLGRARAVVCVSEALAAAARGAGVERVRFVPNGVEIPERVGEEAEPPEVLYAGRLSPEKGIEDLLAAADGLELVVAGDGPLRAAVPQALGMLPRAELYARMERAAVVAVPSRSEGFGVVCAEAMAHARPVVATRAGGLANLVVHGETGLLVPPRDPAALRGALERLLADPELRRRLGLAGRERIAALCSWERVIDETLSVYEEALASTL